MAKRRGDGEGSLYYTRDGRWRGEVSLGYRNGKPLRKVLYANTRADLQVKVADAARQHRQGTAVPTTRQTVGDFLKQWLSGTVAVRNRSETLRSYTWIVEKHLVPSLGHLRLDKLTPQQVQGMLLERHKSGLSPTTVKHIRATLRAALSQAERWGMVARNAAKPVDLPRMQRYVPSVLDPAQAQAFLLSLIGHPRQALYLTAITMGLRRGELLGLRWADVNLPRRSLRVAGALQRVPGSGLQLGETKSPKAKRSLTLPAMTAVALAEYSALQAEQRQWAGTRWHDTGLVFTNSLGKPLQPDDISRELPTLLQAAGLPRIRLHDLRHSCATLLFSKGAHAKLVQETLGHSTYQLTMDTYSHMLPELRNEVASLIDEVLSPTPTEPPTKPTPPQVN